MLIRLAAAAGPPGTIANLCEMAERPEPTVLGVDDHPLNLELLAEYLSGTGCRFVTAGDGYAALEAVERWHPDLVLLDVVMPRLDGIEVCRQIKANPAHRLLPVVLVTSLSTVEDRVRALQAGADDFLTKPVDRHELMARVLTLIRAKEFYDRLDDAEHVMAAFAKVVEAKDCGTEAHVERVARTARALGEAAGLPVPDLDVLYLGGIVHDIGKVGVPDSVLLKRGPLGPNEVAIMRSHVTVGVEIAEQLRSTAGVVPIVRHHHERFDGSGYPDGLTALNIPRIAMIVSICDAYDAMTSDRPYRRAMSPEVAVSELRRGGGSQWDPDLVALFLSNVLRESALATEVSAPAHASRAGSHSRGGR